MFPLLGADSCSLPKLIFMHASYVQCWLAGDFVGEPLQCGQRGKGHVGGVTDSGQCNKGDANGVVGLFMARIEQDLPKGQALGFVDNYCPGQHDRKLLPG